MDPICGNIPAYNWFGDADIDYMCQTYLGDMDSLVNDTKMAITQRKSVSKWKGKECEEWARGVLQTHGYSQELANLGGLRKINGKLLLQCDRSFFSRNVGEVYADVFVSSLQELREQMKQHINVAYEENSGSGHYLQQENCSPPGPSSSGARGHQAEGPRDFDSTVEERLYSSYSDGPEPSYLDDPNYYEPSYMHDPRLYASTPKPMEPSNFEDLNYNTRELSYADDSRLHTSFTDSSESRYLGDPYAYATEESTYASSPTPNSSFSEVSDPKNFEDPNSYGAEDSSCIDDPTLEEILRNISWGEDPNPLKDLPGFKDDAEAPISINGESSQAPVLQEPALLMEQRKMLGKVQATRPHRVRGVRNWEFLMRLLMDPNSNPSLIQWVEEDQGVFRLKKPKIIAQIWASRNNDGGDVSYNNFARGLRHHYKNGTLIPCPERQLVYQCGPKALEFLQQIREVKK